MSIFRPGRRIIYLLAGKNFDKRSSGPGSTAPRCFLQFTPSNGTFQPRVTSSTSNATPVSAPPDYSRVRHPKSSARFSSPLKTQSVHTQETIVSAFPKPPTSSPFQKRPTSNPVAPATRIPRGERPICVNLRNPRFVISTIPLRSFFLRGDFLAHNDPGELYDVRSLIFPVLAEGRLASLFLLGDLSERDIGVTQSRRKFHERAMPET